MDITKVANVILYFLHKQVNYLNDKKVVIMLFLIDYEHLKYCNRKIFGDVYIKTPRYPKAEVICEIFDIIANNKDLKEDDERLYLIQEVLDYMDIEIIKKKNFLELNFIKIEEEFDDTLFNEDEMKTIHKIVSLNNKTTTRNLANSCFQLDDVRNTANGEVII